MSTIGSDESFLRFYESYARGKPDMKNRTPKEPGDFRERVDRETIRGRYTFFHQNIEMYLNRQWRAYTVPRFAMFTFASFGLMQHGFVSFLKTFPNVQAYEKFSHHPNYKLLGPFYSYFYMLRPMFWTYIFFRLSRHLCYMIKDHWAGKDDLHYFWYYDTLYPDMFFDEEDMRYINFRYTDARVAPDPLTGYYPYEHMKYGNFLNKKEDNLPVRFQTFRD